MQTVHPDGSLIRTVYDINNRPIVSQSEYMPTVQSSAGELEVSDSGGTRTVYDGFGRVHFTETLLKVLIAIQLFLTTSTDAERTSREQIDKAGRRTSSWMQFRDSGSGGAIKESVTDYVYGLGTLSTPDIQASRGVALNRVDAAGNTIAEQTVELRTQYDIAGNRVAALDAQGQGTYYGYSALGQLLEVKAPATTSYSTTKYRYDEVGNRVWIQDANGRVTVDSFDSFGRRIQRDAPDAGTNLGIEQWVFDIPPPVGTTHLMYKRDRSGQRRLSHDSIPQSTTPITREFQHTYDPGHRLHREYAFNSINSAYAAGASVEYDVDLVGNRNERKVALVPARDPGYASQVPQATGYNYDAQDKVTGYTLSSAVALTYDSQGNVATHGSSQTYAHDWRNRLIQSGSVTMSYDPEGLRVRKTTSTNSTLYLVDSMNPTGYAQVLCEYQYTGTNAPAVQKAYTYGLDLVSHRLPGGATTKKHYSTDALGTTRFLTGTTGTTVAALVTSNYHYDAFGTLLSSSSSADTAYLYTGEQWDGDVGAYYLRARWYHPGLERFLERDSYEGIDSDPISRNRYLYGSANPVKWVDPSGYMTTTAEAPIIGGWFGGRANYVAGRGVIYASALAKAGTLAELADFITIGCLAGEIAIERTSVREWID